MATRNFFLGAQPSAIRAIDSLGVIARSAPWKALLVHVAYVTRAGARQLVGELEIRWPIWKQGRKLFLVGLDFGLTEPAALRYLAQLPNSECRVYDAEETLRQRLRPRSAYHPKVYAFSDAISFRRAKLVGGVVGSANLTAAGLTTNTEAFLRFAISRGAPGGIAWIQSLAALEASAKREVRLSDALLDRYRRMRPRRMLPPLDTERVPTPYRPNRDLDASHVRALRTARCLWTETLAIVPNLGRGRPGNQVDLKKGVRAFFNSRVPMRPGRPVDTALATVRTVIGGATTNCAMRVGDNGMDKINLPRPGGDHPARYDHRYLFWERLPDGRFRLEVRPNGTAWRCASRNEGSYFHYSGSPRTWGYFDSAIPTP